jgi:hypothetical protein
MLVRRDLLGDGDGVSQIGLDFVLVGIFLALAGAEEAEEIAHADFPQRDLIDPTIAALQGGSSSLWAGGKHPRTARQRQVGRLRLNGVSQVLKLQIQDQAGLLPHRLLRCATLHKLDTGRHIDRAIR